jgi:hypothetical protein
MRQIVAASIDPQDERKSQREERCSHVRSGPVAFEFLATIRGELGPGYLCEGIADISDAHPGQSPLSQQRVGFWAVRPSISRRIIANRSSGHGTTEKKPVGPRE